MTVLEDSKDVTSKAKITISIDDKAITGTSTTLNTTTVGTHTIKYNITYNNETVKSLTKTVSVTEIKKALQFEVFFFIFTKIL